MTCVQEETNLLDQASRLDALILKRYVHCPRFLRPVVVLAKMLARLSVQITEVELQLNARSVLFDQLSVLLNKFHGLLPLDTLLEGFVAPDLEALFDLCTAERALPLHVEQAVEAIRAERVLAWESARLYH